MGSSIYLLGQHTASSEFKHYHELTEAIKDHGECLTFEKASEWLSCYETDVQQIHTKLPLLVFRPNTIHDIAPFVKCCHDKKIPITVRCGGTGMVGGCVVSTRGVILLTGHLKSIRNYDAVKGVICVEPGVTVRQLNRRVEGDGWHFPLEMATQGVAGLGGCLNTAARSYHRQERLLWHRVTSVSLINGEGQLQEMPGLAICGSEGLYGVVIEMTIHLEHLSVQSDDFVYRVGWEEILDKLCQLRSLQALAWLIWDEDTVYVRLEGDEWRFPATKAQLNRWFNKEERHTGTPLLIAEKQPSFMAFSVFQAKDLPIAIQYAKESASEFGLNCKAQANVLEGGLQLLLEQEGEKERFLTAIEHFLVLWADFVDAKQGQLVGCHGIGKLMHPYMTPFWGEETVKYGKKLQNRFDPKGLFYQERFFPEWEKSLKKV